MRTVKELSELTGISVRTLHYYDEIGLLKPTAKSRAGYRLYDDRALETLQQILFFREFDIPLKEIRALMEDSGLEKNQVLITQKKMLIAKKERLERLIASIEDILKGENQMDFTVFSKAEIEEMFQTMFAHIPENMRERSLKEFGGKEQWKKHYLEVYSSKDMQKRCAEVIEWYGGKDACLRAVLHPISKAKAGEFSRRLDAVCQKLYAKRKKDPQSPDVRTLVAEYAAIMKELTQVKSEKALMLQIAGSYRNEHLRQGNEEKYGKGAAEFFALAIEAFYQHSERQS